MSRVQRRTRPAPSAQAPIDRTRTRVNLEYRDINDLAPYPFNPRDNAAAVESLANSIRTFGFLIPVVVDSNNVLVAGHTRVEAAKTLGMLEVPVVQVGFLSEEEVNAFRLIDNKVAEIARWDFTMLEGELHKLSSSGLMMTDFGWTREELDCLTGAMVTDECLAVEGLVDAAAQERMRRMERRAPATARCVIGEIVFFVAATDYRRWIDGIRTQYDYNDSDIVAGIKQRLGITEESVSAQARVEERARTPRTSR